MSILECGGLRVNQSCTAYLKCGDMRVKDLPTPKKVTLAS